MRNMKSLFACLALAATAIDATRASVEDSISDTAVRIVELPDKLNTVIGTLDNDNSEKHYSFTATRGQKVIVSEIHPIGGRSKFKIDYQINGKWRPVPTFSPLITSALEPGQAIQIKVSKNTPTPLTANDTYHIEFGSAPFIHNYDVSGDAQQFSIRFPTTKLSRKTSWQATVLDSTGHPVEGVAVKLALNLDSLATDRMIISEKMSSSYGAVNGEVNLAGCTGRQVTEPFVGVYDFRTRWQVAYNTGFWYMSPGSHVDGGIGSKNGENVPLTHICSQRVVR